MALQSDKNRLFVPPSEAAAKKLSREIDINDTLAYFAWLLDPAERRWAKHKNPDLLLNCLRLLGLHPDPDVSRAADLARRVIEHIANGGEFETASHAHQRHWKALAELIWDDQEESWCPFQRLGLKTDKAKYEWLADHLRIGFQSVKRHIEHHKRQGLARRARRPSAG